MAYDLFSTIAEFKAHIGGGGNVSLDIDSIGPIVNSTAHRHLMKWIGEPLYNDLSAKIEAGTALTAAEQSLLPFIRKPLAMLTMHEYAKIGAIQFGEEGIHRIERDDHKTAYKYQENQYKEFMLENGYEAIETMLKFLETSTAGTYPLWENNARSLNRELFINYASEFRAVYAHYISRYTFENIRPLIDDVSGAVFVPLLGQTEYDNLKTAIASKNSSAVQQSLINLIQRAVAAFAIEEGMKREWVKLDKGNVVQTDALEPQSYIKTGSASMGALSAAVMNSELWANRHVAQIKNFLTTNIDDFTDYKAHIDALAEAEEDEETDNCDERSSCNCEYDCGSNTKVKNKGVVRL